MLCSAQMLSLNYFKIKELMVNLFFFSSDLFQGLQKYSQFILSIMPLDVFRSCQRSFREDMIH